MLQYLQALGTLCFPPHCEGCGADTSAGEHVCVACMEAAQKLEAPFCERCSDPFQGAITESFTCANCGEHQWHFECAVPAYLSRGVVRELIHKFKYGQQRYLRKPLAALLVETLAEPRIASRPFDAFIPVPLHRLRHREREFNQAEELCRLLSKQTARPTWTALQRTRYTSTQTKLDRSERMKNLSGAFRVHGRHREKLKGANILLVDDIFTTGSTVEECAKVLKRAGVESVRVITVARG